VNLDHHELRSAFEQFLAAKRVLRQAYRRSVAVHKPAALRPMLDGMVSKPNWKDPALSEELDGLKEENERLKKSLALLHVHSLRLQKQLDTLILNGTDAGGNSMITHSLSESDNI
jgi:hypothetical protein